jgi:hypothetical protein
MKNYVLMDFKEKQMTHYNNLEEVLLDKDNYPPAGRIFLEKSFFNESKIKDLQYSQYWIMSSKESMELDFVEDERGERIPVTLKDFNVKRLLDIQTFKGIIDIKLENHPDITLEQIDVFVEAILYYLEHDDFMD